MINIAFLITCYNRKKKTIKCLDSLFNQKYNGKLLNEQQELLNRYILSFDSSDLEFKTYLNE